MKNKIFIAVVAVMAIASPAFANVPPTDFNGTTLGDGSVAVFSASGTTLTVQLTASYIAAGRDLLVRFPTSGDMSPACLHGGTQPCVYDASLGVGTPFFLIADDGSTYPQSVDLEIYACAGGDSGEYEHSGHLEDQCTDDQSPL